MKPFVLISVLLLSVKVFGQAADTNHRYAINLGPGLSTGGYSGNVGLSYALQKINIKFRALGCQSKAKVWPDGNHPTTSKPDLTGDFSISVNYFLLGNATAKSKAGLYVGIGAGYMCYINKLSTNYMYATDSSFKERLLTQGLTANACVGGVYKLGPGKIYAEIYYSQIVVGNLNYKFDFLKGNPPAPATTNYTEGINLVNGSHAVLCFNVGYTFYF